MPRKSADVPSGNASHAGAFLQLEPGAASRTPAVAIRIARLRGQDSYLSLSAQLVTPTSGEALRSTCGFSSRIFWPSALTV